MGNSTLFKMMYPSHSPAPSPSPSMEQNPDQISHAPHTNMTAASSQVSVISGFSTSDKSGNPFATPGHSTTPSQTNIRNYNNGGSAFFRSRRVRKEEIQKPWLTDMKDTKAKWQTYIPMIGVFLGFCLAGLNIWLGLRSVPNNTYCSIYEDDFSSGKLDPAIWTREAEVGGYGNGQFEETTTSDENVFIKDGLLNIMPTLQDANLINQNSVIDLTKAGICSSDTWKNCVAVTNTTNGTIVPPARSGRISTKKAKWIKYGRIEVEAKMPTGDWLWPAIWMLPVQNTYGQWPLSGEIDIAEGRGNNYTYPQGGNNKVSATLHWGPDSSNDAWWRTYGKDKALMTTYASGFHIYGVEWSEKYIYMYVDNRLHQIMYRDFDKPLWNVGKFPLSDQNGTAYVDPWSQTGNPSTPFDQDFYLILNVAVGGTNGWFQDGVDGKPWVDASPSAKKDFWNARNKWLPTWTQPAMQVKSIKMWQQKGYNGC